MSLNRTQVRSLLQGIKEEATTASLTGALEGGSRVMADFFNRCRQALIEGGDEGVGVLFGELPEQASVDEIGIAAALLLRYVAAAQGAETRPAGPEGLAPQADTGLARA